jgi:hypothetical protein
MVIFFASGWNVSANFGKISAMVVSQVRSSFSTKTAIKVAVIALAFEPMCQAASFLIGISWSDLVVPTILMCRTFSELKVTAPIAGMLASSRALFIRVLSISSS